MAHKKAGGSTELGRDSKPKMLGVKIYGGQHAKTGNIILRQRGSQYRAGKNVKTATDYTLFAAIDGIVKFTTKKIKRFTGKLKIANFVHIEPANKK